MEKRNGCTEVWKTCNAEITPNLAAGKSLATLVRLEETAREEGERRGAGKM
jgi:hypothetical protein